MLSFVMILPLALSACGRGQSTGPESADIVRLSIWPKDATLTVRDSLDFQAFGVTAAGDSMLVAVSWSVSDGDVKGKGKGAGQYKPRRSGLFKVKATADTLADSTTVTVTNGTLASIEVLPDVAAIQMGDALQLVATLRDSAGTVLTDLSVGWMSEDEQVAQVDQNGLVTAGAAGGPVTITATSGDVSGTANLTVNDPPPNVGEPEYDASNPDHVLHVFEDWSTYSTPADIPTTNRVDGGGPWSTGGTAFQTFTGNPDPWFGTKTLTIDYQDAPPAGQSLGRGLILEDLSNQYLNRNADKESLVIEWAWRWAGTAPYVGKIADWQPAPGIDRFNYQSGRDRLGAQIDNTCDNDPLCSLYYSNGGSQPLFEGLLPTSTSRGGALARSRFDVTHFYIQNRNWGNGPGQVNWGGSSDNTHGINLVDDTWRRTILRLTRNQNGTMGFGRFEEWLQKAGEPAVKVMEYIGDVGGFDEGLVFSRNEAAGGATWFAGGALLDLYTLTAPGDIFDGGSTVHVGFIRIWSHPRNAP